MLFNGSGVALVTPMNEDESINYEKVKELIDWHVEAKTSAIIVAGTTGECSTLSTDEHIELIAYCVKYAKGRIDIIAGTGSNETKIALELSIQASKLEVDGLLVINPYYNKTSESGLLKYFEMIANSVDVPIILYNVPSRTGQNISVSIVLELAKHPNIQGIKEASGDLDYLIELTSKLPNDFKVYSGNDDQILVALAHGASGIISVAANIIPNEISEIISKFKANEIDEARAILFNYLPLIKALFSEVNPIPIKTGMNILGYQMGNTRLPLVDLSKKYQEELILRFKEVGLL